MAYGTLKADVIQSDTAGVAPQFNDGNGTQVGTLCRAWVNFNGTTSPGTIRASFNVGSVTKNGTGDYTINFTTAMPDANYAAASYAHNNSDGSAWIRFVSGPANSVPKTASAFRITVVNVSWANVDTNQIDVEIFR